MAQKKDGKPEVAKATKKVAKKAAVKKAATKAPSKPKAVRATSSTPSYILRQQGTDPQNFSYLCFANMAWGIVWRPSPHPQARCMFRQPLFTLTGVEGNRWENIRRYVERGSYFFKEEIQSDRIAAKRHLDESRLMWLPTLAKRRADLRWIQLWTLGDLHCLNSFAAADDTAEGDIDFIAWIELLLMAEEISDLFRGTNSDVMRAMESSSWLHPSGPGLVLLQYLHQAAVCGLLRNNRPDISGLHDFTQVYAVKKLRADGVAFEALREASGAIFGKVVGVLQSPAMDERFRAFFGGLANELNITPEELWNALYGMSRSSYGDGTYMPLLVAKVGQVFGLLKDFDETPLTLTDALEKWVGWIHGKPKGGWPVGPKYEAKANAERLKLIADTQRKGRVEVPEPAKKRIF